MTDKGGAVFRDSPPSLSSTALTTLIERLDTRIHSLSQVRQRFVDLGVSHFRLTLLITSLSLVKERLSRDE